jgi:hypothetical protein
MQRRKLVCVVLAGLMWQPGCWVLGTDHEGASDGASTFGPGPIARLAYQAELNAKFDAATVAAGAFHQRTANLVAIASSNYATVLSPTTPAPSAVIPVYDAALKGLAGDYMKMMRAAHDVATYQTPATTVTQFQQTSAGIETTRQPLFFAVAAIAIPFAVAGYRHMRNIYDARTEPVSTRIMSATNEELQLIKQTMSLPAEFSRVQTLDHFQNKIGFGERTSRAKDIEAALTLNTDGLANVRPFGQEVNQAVANSAREGGKAAVDLVVSAANNATGGAGIKEIGQAAGLTAKAAEVVDITISAVQTATGEPLQPLDMLSSHLQASVNGGDPTETTLPPAGTTTPEQAKAILAEADPPAEKVGQATAVLTGEMLTKTGGAGDTVRIRTTPEGGSVVTAPARTHIVTVENVTNNTTVSVINAGRADVVIAAKGHRPQTTSNVTIAMGTVVKYRVDPKVAPAVPDPKLLCAVGDYAAAYTIYKGQDRTEGDAYIVTATCAFGFFDYSTAISLALQGASVSSKGGRAHNYFIAELAAQRLGGTGASHGASGLAAAKQSGQCSGAGDPDLCANLYQISVQSGLSDYQESLFK